MSKEATIQVKAQEVAAIVERIQRAKSVVIVDYRGISVTHDTELRSALRKENIEYKVIKNRMFLRALAECGISGLDQVLNGPSAFAFGYDDPVVAARLLAEKAKLGHVKFKGGIVEGQVLSASGIAAVASIPARNTLIAQLLGLLQSPVRSLAVALSEVAKQK